MTLFGGGGDRIGLKRRRVAGGALGMPPFDYNPALATMTVGMRKSLPPAGPFAAAPIIQGSRDGTSVSDLVTFPAGTRLGNPVSSNSFCPALDEQQGTFSLWITPEWNGNDGIDREIWSSWDTDWTLYKTTGNALRLSTPRAGGGVDISGWVAGTTYLVVARWDWKKSIDGTNYICVSVNDVHTFAVTSLFATYTYSLSPFILGSETIIYNPANALIQGLTIYRRVLWDGLYGTDVGNGDEINLIYAAGAGLDPTRVTGSFDVVFMAPTDSAVGPLTTGSLDAWTHPHASALLDDTWMSRGYYGGADYSVGFNGTSTSINCGSGVTLDDIPAGGNIIQVECWMHHDTTVSGGYSIVAKGFIGIGGWIFYVSNSGGVMFTVDLVTTDPICPASATVRDGKWHHVLGTYNDTTKVVRVALDGVWSAASAAGAGNYVTDVAQSLYMGRRSNAADWWFPGAIGWVRIHNHAHYTPGTDFVAPRANPGVDANTVELWDLDEGSGVTATATVTTPANDGTISNGTWVPEWVNQWTPTVPTQLVCDGAATYVNCGTDASIDDIPSTAGVFTWDGWVRLSKYVTTGVIVEKGNAAANTGWCLQHQSGPNVAGIVQLATTDSFCAMTSPSDNRWHHIAMYYSNATNRSRIAIDGVWGTLGGAGAGAYQLDAAANLNIGRKTAASNYFTGGLSWQRYSNNDRFGGATGTRFVPPSRTSPPVVDANTVEQWNFLIGAGLTVPALVNVLNNGTITLGSGYWLSSCDMERGAPGQRAYPWGYAAAYAPMLDFMYRGDSMYLGVL